MHPGAGQPGFREGVTRGMGPQRMFGMTPWVRRLLVANLLVFLLQQTVVLHADRAFAFNPVTSLSHPWTAVT